MTRPVRHLSVSIQRSFEDVYRFAANVENLPLWATGLGTSLAREGEVWVADGPAGRVTVKFCSPNTFGVLDHEVTLASGDTVPVFLRVIPNDTGAEVTFSLLRRPAISDGDFDADIRWVEKDLRALKTLLER